MSDQKPNYMAELNRWIDDFVVEPLRHGDSPEDPNARSWDVIIDDVHSAIREKVLQSYRNGLAAAAAKSRVATKQRAK